MLNLRKICVLDFETDSPEPMSCEPVELAAIMIDPRNLSFIKGSEFHSLMKPIDIDTDEYYETHKDTIDWHSKVLNKSPLEILKSWQTAPLQKNAWGDFKRYLEMYHMSSTRKSSYSAPIIAGQNILGFDAIIIDRLSERYNDLDKKGRNKLFFSRDKIDTLSWMFLLWENCSEPTAYNMDTIRDYLGMKSKGSHTAMKDVKDTGELIIRIMRLMRNKMQNVNFKNACKKNPLK